MITKSEFCLTLIVLVSLFVSCNTNQTDPPEPVLPVPDEKQLAWHELEQYAFIHFTTNTFTGKEWGYGDESPDVFNPSELDARQWARVIKEAGMKGIILTCKHHDGFCLWPSEYTEHTVANSPYKNGEGDVVREVSEACKEYGLKFGIYLSPWDRNRADYGKPSYIDYYRNQLTELFTEYGPVFEMWFDGANGGDGYYGGARETRKIDQTTYYDWPTTLDMVRELEPSVIFFSQDGPDVRWCGNEKGYVGKTNWNTFDTVPGFFDKERHVAEKDLNTGMINGDVWMPAEVDVSIRPGWFYHEEEDSLVKSPEELFDIYLTSVGRGSNLLLNIPPDRRGLLHENDVQALQGWKKMLDEAFDENLAENAAVKASDVRGNAEEYAPENMLDDDKTTYWSTEDEVTSASFEIDLKEKQELNFLVIQEYIRLGQRVKSFQVEVWKDGEWQPVASPTTIGYKRIVKLNGEESDKLRVTIAGSKACPVISAVEVY